MKTRLSKALASAGVASRRACEELIFSGYVNVNGLIITLPQFQVDTRKDLISVKGQPVNPSKERISFAVHKPCGYLCTNKKLNFASAKIVADLLPHIDMRLFTAGRLDQDTSGLIIFTNDGDLANKVSHPSFNVSKEYLVRTGQEITDRHLKTISEGMFMDGSFVKPVSVEKVRKGNLKIIVKEGKHHEVRRLMEKAKLTVLELSRIRVGSIVLAGIPLGGYRELSDAEISEFLGKTACKKTTSKRS